MESVEDCGLVENIGCRRIEILRFSFIGDTPREGDGMTREIGNREDDASVKLIPPRTDEYPRIDNILLAKILLAHFREKLARISGVSELESADGVFGDATSGEVFELRVMLREENRIMVKIGRDAVHVVHVAPLLAPLVVKIGLELDSRLLSEDLERLAELDLLDLHEESDRSTAVMAPKTVRQIFGRRDHERWRLLAMERTERLIVGPRLLHLQIASGDVHDIDAGFDVLGDGHECGLSEKMSVWSL